MEAKQKKGYVKPQLKTNPVQLGVFGEYGNNSGGNPGSTDVPYPPKPRNLYDYMSDY